MLLASRLLGDVLCLVNVGFDMDVVLGRPGFFLLRFVLSDETHCADNGRRCLRR